MWYIDASLSTVNIHTQLMLMLLPICFIPAKVGIKSCRCAKECLFVHAFDYVCLSLQLQAGAL